MWSEENNICFNGTAGAAYAAPAVPLHTYDLSGRVVGIQKLRGKATAPGAQLGSVEYVYEDGTARLKSQKTVTPFGSDTLTLTYGLPIYGKSPDRVYEVWENGQKQKTYSYDALGRLISSSLPSSMGRTDSYTYQDIGSSGRTSTRVASYLCGGLYFTYTYDADGRIKTVSKNGTLTESYDYGLDGSLLDATIGNDRYHYMYDTNGNLLTVFHNGQSVSYNYDDLFWGDLLTNYNGTSISYDTIGNPLNWRDGMAMTWLHGRELSSVTKGGKTFAYSYGADGVRTQKTVDGVTTEYYTVGSKLLAEKTGDQVLTFYYDDKGAPVSVELNGTRYYYHQNLQGDVVGLYSSTGAQVVSYTYDPWGKLLNITDTSGTDIGALNPLRYRGYYYDTETGLYYVSSRYYDPETCRFINADSQLNMDDGVLGANMFAYCMNDPVNMTDSSGHCPFWNGVRDFFVGQWNSIKAVVSDPVGSYVNYMTDPWNWVLPAKIFKQSVTEVAGMWKDVGTGNIDSLAYKTGQKAGAAAEVVATMGAAKAVPKIATKINTLKNPLSNIEYTSKVQAQMELGDNHSFPKIVDNYGGLGLKENIIGGDGIMRTKVSISGAYNGKVGIFEYIIEPNGTCNHRLFK